MSAPPPLFTFRNLPSSTSSPTASFGRPQVQPTPPRGHHRRNVSRQSHPLCPQSPVDSLTDVYLHQSLSTWREPSGEPLLPDVPQTSSLPHRVALAATSTPLAVGPHRISVGAASPASFGQGPKGRGGFAHLAGPG
jgi:hypothetical protein